MSLLKNPIICKDFCRKLQENERNRTEKGRGARDAAIVSWGRESEEEAEM